MEVRLPTAEPSLISYHLFGFQTQAGLHGYGEWSNPEIEFYVNETNGFHCQLF